ncbi:MAG: metallophosphoesterase [Lachnospiraceae bacterium]|nr:metallophosphoesterase [Lachnospiraceae bacterium]
MKILVVSDTHGRLDHFQMVLKRVAPVDRILHLGDVEGDEEFLRGTVGCPIIFVAGNCDRLSREPWERVVELAGHRIFMSHGHRYGVHRGLARLNAAAEEAQADVVLYGHTHVPDLSYIGERAFLNPGSLSLPRQEGHSPSFAILEIDAKGQCHFSINFLKNG